MRLARFGFVPWILLGALAAGCSRKAATIDIAPKRVKIYGIDRAQRLTARLLDKKGQPMETGSPSFSSSKTSVVAVDSSGRLVANGEGKAIVTASYEKLSVQVAVEVVDVKEIEVSPISVPLIAPLGTQFPLQATSRDSKNKPVVAPLTWTSTNPKVAAVSPEGVVTSQAPGTTTVIARLGDLQAACEIRVIPQEIARVEIRPATAIVKVGDTQRFEVIAYGPDGKSIEGAAAIFRSSDPSVATVDPLGKASGIATGTATIRATLSVLSAEATLLVN